MKINICKYFLPFFYGILMLSCFVNETEGNNLASLGFSGNTDEIILKLDNADAGYREHFLLGLACKSKNKNKEAIFHFANSCFRYTTNLDLKLYPYPVYQFLDEFHIKSEFYNDSAYEIARLFFEYQEYEYAVKFINLMSDSELALYRDGAILKSKALQSMDKNTEALSVLNDIYGRYNDVDSKSDIHIRIASVYEKQNDSGRAVNEYLKIVSLDNKSWQSASAADRILQLIKKSEYKFKEADILMLIAALYNSSKYSEAAGLIKPLLEKNPSLKMRSSASEYLVKLFVRMNKNAEAENFFSSFKTAFEDYAGYQMIMADELWSMNEKEKAVKIYRVLCTRIKEPSRKAVLKRIAIYSQRERVAGFEKETDVYVNEYPDDAATEYFLWILAKERINTNDFSGALGYLEKAESSFPNGIYSAQIRFWMYKIYSRLEKNDEAEKMLADLTFKNPDSYYTWNALLKQRDIYNINDLYGFFNRAVTAGDIRKAVFYNALILINDGDFDKRDIRIEAIKSSGLIEKYRELDTAIKDLKIDPQYKDTLRGIEKYFSIGYTDGINRETALIPKKADSIKSKYIALSHYGIMSGSYFYALIGTLKLVNQRPLSENVAFLPRDIIKNLYPDAYSGEIEKRCKEMDIDKNIVLSIIKAESSFNRQAVSSAGAQGLMQIMPSTGRGIARELNIKDFDLQNPQISILFGVKYIAWLKKIFNNDFDDIAAGYNAGANNVKKWKNIIITDDRDNYIENIPFDETRSYILRTRKYFYIYNLLHAAKGFYN